jgi:hypothetical protein
VATKIESVLCLKHRQNDRQHTCGYARGFMASIEHRYTCHYTECVRQQIHSRRHRFLSRGPAVPPTDETLPKEGVC